MFLHIESSVLKYNDGSTMKPLHWPQSLMNNVCEKDNYWLRDIHSAYTRVLFHCFISERVVNDIICNPSMLPFGFHVLHYFSTARSLLILTVDFQFIVQNVRRPCNIFDKFFGQILIYKRILQTEIGTEKYCFTETGHQPELNQVCIVMTSFCLSYFKQCFFAQHLYEIDPGFVWDMNAKLVYNHESNNNCPIKIDPRLAKGHV